MKPITIRTTCASHYHAACPWCVGRYTLFHRMVRHMCEVEAVEALLPVESQTLSLAFLAEQARKTAHVCRMLHSM